MNADDVGRLLPCPFCGSEAAASTSPSIPHESDAIQCTNPSCDAFVYYVGRSTWNRRAVAQAVPEWRPIESAPREGKIDIWTVDGKRYTGCYWDKICGEYRTSSNGSYLICLPLRICKCWMPIPTPPTADQEPGK